MSLHNSKRVAILQWFNSFSSYDLSKIVHLADGKHFCDIINAVFNIIPPFSLAVNSPVIELETSSEQIFADFNTQTIPEQCPENNLETGGNIEPTHIGIKDEINLGANNSQIGLSDVDVKTKTVSTVDVDTNSETEPYPFDIDTTDDSEASKIEKEVKYIQGELSKALGNKPEGFDSEDKENKSVDIEKDIFGDKVPVIEKKKSKSKSSSKTELVSKKNDKNEKKSELEVIIQRFDFVKRFIDEMYCVDSATFVDYTLCMESVELELAKVAILILSLMVRQYIKTNNSDHLNTLTLLDMKVQEDIQECLFMLLQEEKISKKEIHRILSNPAKYKLSPRKSPRFSTPGRNRSSLRNSVLSMTVSHEDIFSDSPLKSFLDSPQLKQILISKDVELVKARKILHAEELRSEELQLEVNHLKKKLDDKDKEIQKLKSEIRELKSKEEDQECEICFDLKNKLKSAKSAIKDLEEDNLRKDKLYEEENSKLTHELTMLQGKLQCLIRKQKESVKNVPDNVVEIVKIKDEEIDALKSSNSKLKMQLEEMLRNYSFAQSHIHVPKAEEEKDESNLYCVSPGECIGSIIEEENKVLRQKLLQAQKTLDKLLRKWDIKESIVEDFKKNLNLTFRNESKFLDSSYLSENSKALSLNELDRTNLSSASSASTPKEMKPHKLSTKKRKFSGSTKDSVSPGAFGALWAQYNNSDVVSDTFQSDITEDKNIDLFKQLGFSETDYPMKIEVIKKFLSSLKELFYQNGSNGLNNFPALADLDQTLKSEEDCLKCLLYIRESLLRFLNHTPVLLPKCEIDNSEAAEKSVCCCDSKLEIIDLLQKENEELKFNLSKSKSISSAELEEKLAEIRELSSQLEAAENQNQELSKIKVNLRVQNKELTKKTEELKTKLSKMSLKCAEIDHFRELYLALSTEKTENEHLYRRQIKLCREKILNFDIQKKEFQTTIEKEKKIIKEMMPQIELFKNEIIALKIQRRNLDKQVKELKTENRQLTSFTELLKERMLQQKLSHEKTISIYTSNLAQSHPSKSQGEIETTQNIYNINLDEKMQNCNKLSTEVDHKTFQQSSTPIVTETAANRISKSENAHPESCHESSMSSIVFNKSVHHGSLMLFTDDEEGFLNYSSIAEIKKDYDPSSKDERLQELKRRNTLCLPHMKSSYPIELQNMSPFNVSLYEHIKKTPKLKDNNICDEECKSSLSCGEHSVKKRKATELEEQSVSEAGPSAAVPATPDVKMRKTFKTPASLKKLLNYRKKLQRANFSKTKC